MNCHKQFCYLRNKVQKLIKKAKSKYLENKIEENKGNSRSLWKQFKGLGHERSNKSNPKTVLHINGENCHDGITIANHFNNFFTTVASKLVDKLPPCKGLFHHTGQFLKTFTLKEIQMVSNFIFDMYQKILFLKSYVT